VRVRDIARLVLAVAMAALLGGCLTLSLSGRRGQRLVLETLIGAKGFWTVDKVLLVAIDGVLTDASDRPGMFSRPSVLVQIKDVLDRAEEDRTIRALLIRINSPGGTVTASDLIHSEIQRFKAKTGKKVVVVCMDVAASGGYYVAMAGDRVMAHPTTVTGSIGVIGIFPGLGGLSQKVGLSMRVVKSGELKDMGSLWRTFSEKEQAILQEMIDSMYARFLAVVEAGRPGLDGETIRRLADGRIYSADQALEAGLIDGVGYIEDAFAAAKAEAGLRDAALVTYKYPGGHRGHYYASAPAPPPAAVDASAAPLTQVNLLNFDAGSLGLVGGARFWYLWLP
jgi:protease-4